MKWIDAMWAELGTHPDAEQVVQAAEYISVITRELLPELARYRRIKVAQILDGPDWDSRRLADTIGSSKNAVTRLAEEGRQMRRQDLREQTVHEVPPQ